MQYTQLNAAQQREIITSRIAQFEQTHFNHEMNVRGLEASSLDEESKGTAIAAERANQATLEEAIAAHQAELAALDEG